MANQAAAAEIDDLLARLAQAQAELIEALKALPADSFEKENADGESVKRLLERTADDVNFYYGRLVARALKLPQPPCMQRAEFLSLREATMSLQVAHRRFGNLLHDLIPEDLDRTAEDDDGTTFSLRQVLEMAAAHYRLRRQQVAALAGGGKRRRRGPAASA